MRSEGATVRAYYISLCYEAYYGKTMEVLAGDVGDACRLAMERADDECNWRDTLFSSSHWIENVDDDAAAVPVEYTAAAIRAGGAILLARKLRDALASIIVAYEASVSAGGNHDEVLVRSKKLLESVPHLIGDD